MSPRKRKIHKHLPHTFEEVTETIASGDGKKNDYMDEITDITVTAIKEGFDKNGKSIKSAQINARLTRSIGYGDFLQIGGSVGDLIYIPLDELKESIKKYEEKKYSGS